MKKDRKERAKKHLLNEYGVDRIIETRTTVDFVECVCKKCGDLITFRVYEKNGNFSVTER